jgi:hypothetical protein
MVPHACNASTQEAEAEGSEILDYIRLCLKKHFQTDCKMFLVMY